MLGAGVGVVALGALWYLKNKLPSLAAVGATVGSAAQAVNPLNRDNVFYAGVNAAGAQVTGDRDFSLGAKLWEWVNPGQTALERSIVGGAEPVDNTPWTFSIGRFSQSPTDIDDADMGMAMDVMRANSGAAFSVGAPTGRSGGGYTGGW